MAVLPHKTQIKQYIKWVNKIFLIYFIYLLKRYFLFLTDFITDSQISLP